MVALGELEVSFLGGGSGATTTPLWDPLVVGLVAMSGALTKDAVELIVPVRFGSGGGLSCSCSCSRSCLGFVAGSSDTMPSCRDRLARRGRTGAGSGLT